MTNVKVCKEYKTPDDWNDIILSLATSGGIITSDAKMAKIRVRIRKRNAITHIQEHIFLSYWIDKRQLKQLYSEIIGHQEELRIHAEDLVEQEKIAWERENSLLKIKNKKVIIYEPDDIESEGDDKNYER